MNHHPHQTLDRIARTIPVPTQVSTCRTLSIPQPEHGIVIDVIAQDTPTIRILVQIWTDDGRLAHIQPNEDQPTSAEPDEVARAINRAVAGWLAQVAEEVA